MERSITLGGKEYKYKVTVRLNCELLKYRNIIQTGFDVTSMNKGIVAEILEMRKEVEKISKEKGENVKEEDVLGIYNKLSPEAKKFLNSQDTNIVDKFSYEDLSFITSKLTGVEDQKEIDNILNAELEESGQAGFDKVVTKLINAIAEVFSNAKANS